MSQTKIEKDFDCLEFKQQVQEKIASEIKNLTPPEQIQYFCQKAESSSLGQHVCYPLQKPDTEPYCDISAIHE